MPGPLRTFRDLHTYAHAVDQAQAVFLVALDLPAREQRRLADQMIRASRAVPALIAEAWARRHYPKAFREKLSQALAESMEVQVWLECALRCKYIERSTFEQLDPEWQRLGGMLRRMMQEAAKFGGRRGGQP